MCIDNLYGLRAAFAHVLYRSYPDAYVTSLALNLVRADMSHPAVGRYMPEHYHVSVSRARQWLRDGQETQRIAAE